MHIACNHGFSGGVLSNLAWGGVARLGGGGMNSTLDIPADMALFADLLQGFPLSLPRPHLPTATPVEPVARMKWWEGGCQEDTAGYSGQGSVYL
jgi:hypothetical protein